MLVISRKPEEFLQIGDNVKVKIIKTARGSVKIGIEAPGGMRILRGELSDDEYCEPAELAAQTRRDLYHAITEGKFLAAEAAM